MEAIQIASAAPNGRLDQGILTGTRLVELVSDVFHDHSEDPDDSQYEGSKGQTAKVVSECPPEPFPEGELASGVLSRCEIPSACSHDDDIIEVGLNELVNPEEREDL
jgi:hypothetical protein